MPIYEYYCPTCGTVVEVLQGIGDPPPACRCGATVRRIVSPPAIRFKGSGFYVNDYPKAGEGPEGHTS